MNSITISELKNKENVSIKNRRMPKYSESKIYSIRSHQTDKVYIGSTTQPLAKRFGEHKSNYNAFIEKRTKIYNSSFEMLKYDDCYIELIRKFQCESKNELAREEGIEIRKNDCVNKNIAGRTIQEWREENREQLLQNKREYYQNNAEIIKAKFKEYRQKNLEIVKQKAEIYLKKPEVQERLKKLRSQKIICEVCNCEVTKYNIKRHQQSKKHIENTELQEEESESEESSVWSTESSNDSDSTTDESD